MTYQITAEELFHIASQAITFATKMPIYELSISIGKLFGIEMKESVFYNTYANIRHRQGDRVQLAFGRVSVASNTHSLNMQIACQSILFLSISLFPFFYTIFVSEKVLITVYYES